MRKAVAIWLLALGWPAARAQIPQAFGRTSFELLGKIMDSTGSPLPNATVQVVSSHDTLTTLSGEDGSFIFHGLTKRTFLLNLTMRGYSKFSHVYNVTNGKSLMRLQSILLKADFNELEPVIVRRVRPIIITEDTISYNTAAFPVGAGSDVEDILKRLPGVEVDMDGNVIIQGKKIDKVFVNGKEFFGGDVLLAISNLPADVVTKLQVIDDYGDQARLTGVKSGESVKILNIVLDADRSRGGFGRLEAAGGDQTKYVEDCFTNSFSGERQIAANASLSDNSMAGSDRILSGRVSYADKWSKHWDGSINWNDGSQSPHYSSSTQQEVYYSGQQLDQIQSSQNSFYNSANNLSMKLNFKPENNSSFHLTVTGGANHSNDQITNNFTSLEQDSGVAKSTSGQSKSSGNSAGQNLNATLYYEKISPHSRARFNIRVNFGENSNNQYSNSFSDATVVIDSISNNSILQYLITSKSMNNNFNVGATYFLPFGSASFVDFECREQSSLSFNNIRTQRPDSATGLPVTIDSLSQVQDLHFFSQNFHIGYSAKINRLQLSASFEIQPGQLRGTVNTKGDVTSFSYFSGLPRLQATWNLKKNKKVSINYSGSPNLPSLGELAPFTNLTNPQYPITGNPNLKEAYTNNLSLHYEESSIQSTQFSGFYAGVGYTSTEHTIIQDVYLPKDSSQVIQATTYVNGGMTNNLHAEYHYSFPALFGKHLRIIASGYLGRNRDISITDSIVYSIFTWNVSQALHFQLLIPDVIEASLQAKYSCTQSTFPNAENLPSAAKSAMVDFSNRYYFLKKFSIFCQFSETYSSNGNKLQADPLQLKASLQWRSLFHNKATIDITGYNLLNQAAQISESVSINSTSQTKSQLTGRYLLLTFKLKLQRFR